MRQAPCPLAVAALAVLAMPALALAQAPTSEPARQQAPAEEATRAPMLAALDTWFLRLPGRYRIEGKIESRMLVRLEGGAGMVPTTREGPIKGVADCQQIGTGAGVDCILNATWQILDGEQSRPKFRIGRMGPIPKQSPSEMLDSMRPAVLVLGLDMELPGIRAMMVNADSLAHVWVGSLQQDTAHADRINRCLTNLCLQPLEIIARPDSDDIAIILHSGSIILTLNMHRDPEARAGKPVKSMRAR